MNCNGMCHFFFLDTITDIWNNGGDSINMDFNGTIVHSFYVKPVRATWCESQISFYFHKLLGFEGYSLFRHNLADAHTTLI